jgi:hypothetical protein
VARGDAEKLARGTRGDKTKATGVGLSDDCQTDGVRNEGTSTALMLRFDYAGEGGFPALSTLTAKASAKRCSTLSRT